MEPSVEPAAPAAPSSAASSAKPISPAQLSAEIQPKMPAAPAPSAGKPPVLPQVPDQKPSPPRPDFKSALKDRVLNKGGEEKPAPEPAKPVAAETPAKKTVTFEATVKKPDSAPAPTKKDVVNADDAPPPAKPTASEEQPVPEDQRRVMPHDKPDTARRIKAILAERDAERQAAAAAKKELEEAKKNGASSDEIKKLKEEHERVREEALRLRRLHDIKNDKEFNEKYDAPVRQVDATISETLKRYNFGDATLKAIEAEGGFAAFSRSNKTFTVTEADPENPGQSKKVQKTAAQLAREWVAGMDVADAEAVRAGLGKQQLLQSEKQAAIEKEQAAAKEYFEKQGQQSSQQQKATQEALEKNMREYKEWHEKAVSETDFLRDEEAPGDATPEQQAAIKARNEHAASLREALSKDPTNAAEYGQMKLDAVRAKHLERQLADKDAEIARLNEQLKQKSAALRTTPKGGSILKGGPVPAEKKDPVNPNDVMGSLKGNLRKRLLGAQEEE